MASDIVREGVFAINKPCGSSSAQMIRECQAVFNTSQFFKPVIDAEKAKRLAESKHQYQRRKTIRKAAQIKIGHGGTLDPLATGILILGIGSATKALPQFLECTKTYETTILFGASTDTYDRVGRCLAKRPYEHVTKEKVEEVLDEFRGKRTQIPPLYSALKMDGKPLYEYAREGKPIPREIVGREVEVKEMELVEFYPPGEHPHRWPLEEAEAAERNLAEQVWRVKKLQEEGRKMTPEEREEDDQAIAAHESFKKKFEQRQDDLVRDSPKRQNQKERKGAMMSGALGTLPEPQYSKKGQNLVPEAPAENTPPPWKDEGPPAVKIRMTVTSGYYVRSFCHDLGAKLGSAALMAELCRVRQSDFTIGGPNTLEHTDLSKGEEVWGPKVADMLARWNGEPEGTWQPSEETATATASQDSRPEKRRRSASVEDSERPRKAAAQEPAAQEPVVQESDAQESAAQESAAQESAAQEPAAKSDDDKSWKGIEN